MTQLIIIGIYLSLLLGLGLFAGTLFRGTSRDYLLASHSIGPVLLLMSIFGTTMTAFALVGSTGEAFKEGVGVYGMLASSSGIVHSLCIFIFGVKLWSLGHRHGYKTQIQFFRDRLESDKIGLLLFPVLVGLVIPYLLIGVMASGSVINGVTQGNIVDGKVVDPTFEEGTFPAFLEQGREGFAADGSRGGVPRQLASLVICAIVLLYVFFGGMRGTAWANTFQTTVFLVLGVVTFFVIANRLGGQDGFLENLRTASSHVPQDKLTRTNIRPETFLTYMLIPASIGMFPHVFQHWLTAKNAAAFKLPVIVHPIFILIVWLPCVLVGVWATSDLIQVPPPVQANPNIVLPFMVRSLAGPLLGGFLTAGILAAIMSSLDSQFLCIGTMFTEDIALHYGDRKNITDRREVLLARTFIVAVVGVTYCFSLFEPRRVFTLGVWCFSGFTSLVPLVCAALYWRRLTKAGAYACVLAAAGSWIYLFQDSNYALNASYTVNVGAVSPTIVSKLSDREYEFKFAPESERGAYTLIVGPRITDSAGNAMDQQQDITFVAGQEPGAVSTDTPGLQVIGYTVSGATSGTVDTITLTFSAPIAEDTLTAARVSLIPPGAYRLMPVTAMIAASTIAMVVVSLVTPPPAEQTLAKFFPKPSGGSIRPESDS